MVLRHGLTRETAQESWKPSTTDVSGTFLASAALNNKWGTSLVFKCVGVLEWRNP